MNFNKHLILSLVVLISLVLAQGVFAYDNILEGNTKVEVIDSGDGYIKFQEDGAEKMRITGGNVGIGTIDPNFKLEVSGGDISITDSVPDLLFTITDATKYARFKFVDPGSSTAFAVMHAIGTDYGTVGRRGDFEFYTTSYGKDISFWTDGTERMRVLKSGNVGIGTADPGTAKLKVVGSIVATNTVTTGSSRTLKKEIQSISHTEAAQALMALDPVSFRYKANDAELNIGFIAEDVPEMVATNDRKGLNSMDLVTLAITVIQEQQKEMEKQQDRIEQLEKTVTDLSNNKI